MHDLYKAFCESSGVTTDSRSANKGMMFFALKGDRFNGNEFALQALNQGASYAVVDEPKYATDERFIVVENVLQTLSELATYHRRKIKCPVLAITGSNGKTTTKELIVQVLSRKFKLTSTKGNLNNHIGLPLTILSADLQTEMMILEMGANHPGEIDYLCKIAQPDFGIITNVGKAHLEGFGSPEAVFQTKTELYRWIMQHGKGLIVNADDIGLFKAAGDQILFSYGIRKGMITGTIANEMPTLSINWTYRGKRYDQPTQLFGSYNIYNVLAAVACGLCFETEPDVICSAVSGYMPQNNRSQYIETRSSNKVILDAYNANPTSMNLALDDFFAIQGTPKYLFLGSMLELGEYSDDEHLAILKKLADNQPEYVALVGNEFVKFQTLFPDFNYYASSDVLNSVLSEKKITGAYIIIKGSRGNALEKIMINL